MCVFVCAYVYAYEHMNNELASRLIRRQQQI